ncbi:MAG: sugar transferase [Bacteroidales bacterium]|jgi:exopolysaccharide biosynthesis polyprenyl glycosylphosphotransferase|nr:sugar transferase [Bacteroidales bacterium]
MNKRLQTIKYLLFDFFSAASSWTLFYIYRKKVIESELYGFDVPLEFTNRYYLGIIIIPFLWIFLYYLSGYYKDIYRKSRLKELWQTFATTLTGSILIFFIFLLDDQIAHYKHYYQLFMALAIIHFFLTYIPRLVITSITNHKIHTRKIGFNTVIIGGNKKAVNIYQKIEKQKQSVGNKFIGFITLEEKERYLIEKYLPNLGNFKNAEQILDSYAIEEVIIALETKEHKEIEKIINYIDHKKVVIKAIPSMYDILMGKVKMTHILGTPIIQISHSLMPTWQEHAKQAFDIILSILALILFLPLFLVLAIGIKITSRGPILYSHERIGRFGKPFTLYKFRSMYVDAEKNGPELSSKNDDRITPFGRFLRKTKLDELPNFWNVLKGDMSIVGPRPERKYYIDQIVRVAPHYLHLQKVKPGITSWGQVKYGYAENVDQMVKRLKYDILYIENMSLYVDFKIIIYTLLTILRGGNI